VSLKICRRTDSIEPLTLVFLMGGSDQRGSAAPVDVDNEADKNVIGADNEDGDDDTVDVGADHEIEAIAVPAPPQEGTAAVDPPVEVSEQVCKEDSGFAQVAGRSTCFDAPANVLGTDFALCSTYKDALCSMNDWKFCNFNDPRLAFHKTAVRIPMCL